MDDRAFGRLLEFLGLSWPGYRRVRKGVKKRVGRHMQAYLEKLMQNKEVRRQCERLMCVSISRFFRDRRLWEAL